MIYLTHKRLYQEFKNTDLIGWSTDSGKVIDITLHNILSNLKLMDESITDDLSIEYAYEHGDIEIWNIFNSETGDSYRQNKHHNILWTTTDEVLTTNLLMWAELGKND